MKRCPITYELIPDFENYSQKGLRLLSPTLKNLHPLQLSAAEQRAEAIARAGKMSIQGVQPKLSAQLKIKEQQFEIVDQYGRYILKTQSADYPELPENEAITMTMAATIGIDVPIHGLIYAKDNSMCYFIKRFDRAGHSKKIALEDFTQLSGFDRATKYNSSMEQVASVIEKYCTFPKIELMKLFRLTLFNFLVGNEDMHLKNFSLISQSNKIQLSPAYDLLNTTIALTKVQEELALPVQGKKNNLTKNNLIRYFAFERLKLNETVVNDVTAGIKQAKPRWVELINDSFLSNPMKQKYLHLLEERYKRLSW